jgi:hypothetical protein
MNKTAEEILEKNNCHPQSLKFIQAKDGHPGTQYDRIVNAMEMYAQQLNGSGEGEEAINEKEMREELLTILSDYINYEDDDIGECADRIMNLGKSKPQLKSTGSIPEGEEKYSKEDLWQCWCVCTPGAKISKLHIYREEFEAWLKIGLPKATLHKLTDPETQLKSQPPNQWQASREEWVEIKEGCEMPEVSEDVLMFVESSLSNGKIVRTIYTGFRDDYEGWHFGEEGEHIGPERKATHWRKLPEAPKLNK